MSPRQQNLNLTSRQEEVLRFIQEQVEEQGSPPSYREIGERFGIRSTNGVKVILDALERKGHLRRRANRARSLEPVDVPATPRELGAKEIPLIGRVAAGDPILATGNVEDILQVDASLVRQEESFALEVHGDSMVEAGILDGDIVVARVQETARAGELVVALIGEEATVKFFFPEGERVRLQPANADYRPIIVDRASEELRIAGKVTGLMRRM